MTEKNGCMTALTFKTVPRDFVHLRYRVWMAPAAAAGNRRKAEAKQATQADYVAHQDSAAPGVRRCPVVQGSAPVSRRLALLAAPVRERADDGVDQR